MPFTSDPDEVYDRIAHAKPFGRTSLLDAIHMAMGEMKHARNTRKALVIVSDGGDNRSRHTEREIKNAMLESDLQVYAMGIFDPDDTPKHSIEEQNGPKLLEELADESGGREYPVTSLNDLPSISARIGNQLRNQYLLGYSPTNSERDGKYRIIRLTSYSPDGNTRLTRLLSPRILFARLVTRVEFRSYQRKPNVTGT